MVYVPLRELADVDDVIHDVLTAGGVVHGADVPADLADRLPYVSGHGFGGAAVHPQFLDRATASLDAWADSRRAASDLAETCRVLLYRAWLYQTRHAGASVSKFTEVSRPSPLPSGLDGVWRFNATYSLHVRV